jgi:hypothetical protein
MKTTQEGMKLLEVAIKVVVPIATVVITWLVAKYATQGTAA